MPKAHAACRLRAVTVGGVRFTTKKALGAHVSRMRDTGTVDQRFMRALFEFHEHRVEKLRGRTVRRWRINGRRDGFEMVFTDGSVDTVSFRKLVKNAWQLHGKSPEQRAAILAKNRRQTLVQGFKQAARHEIYDQIRRFRTHCASADPKFANGARWHVGHNYDASQRFEELLEAFFREQPAGTRVHLEPVVPGSYTLRWAERDVAAAWQAYHQAHAVLRMETARANLTGNRGFAAKANWAQHCVAGYAKHASLAY